MEENSETSEQSSKMDVSAIIVNYNGGDMLSRCIAALRDTSGHYTLEIIVVDNGSHDNSLDLLEEHSAPDHLIRAGRNLGFARANNLGAQVARGSYLLFVNTDCFVRSDTVAGLRSVMEAEATCGAAGPRLLNPDGSLQLSCHNFPGPLSFFLEQSNAWKLLKRLDGGAGLLVASDHMRMRPVDWLLGACFMVRAKPFRELDGFSESYFFYWEEADLSRRLRNAGLETIFVPGVEAVHIGGGSSGGQNGRMLELFYRGLYLFCARHCSAGRLLGVRAISRLLALLKAARSLVRALVANSKREVTLSDAKSWWRISRL